MKTTIRAHMLFAATIGATGAIALAGVGVSSANISAGTYSVNTMGNDIIVTISGMVSNSPSVNCWVNLLSSNGGALDVNISAQAPSREP